MKQHIWVLLVDPRLRLVEAVFSQLEKTFERKAYSSKDP